MIFVHIGVPLRDPLLPVEILKNFDFSHELGYAGECQ